jgi:hypothetical protein
MKNSIFFLVIMLSTVTFSQEKRGLNNTLLDLKIRNIVDADGVNIDLSQVSGSPYLQATFESGLILMLETNDTLKAQMRYNIYGDEIEVQKEGEVSLKSVVKDPDIQCEIGNKKFHYINEFLGYMEVLYDGNTSLFVKHQSTYVEAEPDKTPMHQKSVAKFKNKEILFLELRGVFVELPKKNDDFYKEFGDKETALRNYVKENQLKISRIEDLIQILKYFDSL